MAEAEAITNPKPAEEEGSPDLKRKASEEAEEPVKMNGHNKKPKAEAPPRKNNAIYVTSLPLDVTTEELHDEFRKYGVIAENVEGDKPRIKIYTDEDGKPKGEALIVYFKPEAVPNVIYMLDGTDFRYGQKLDTGPMSITEADSSYKRQKEQPLAGDQAKAKGTGANRDRQKVIQKNEQMKSRLADWSDDEEPQSIVQTSNRWDKVLVLKHMFVPEALVKNPAEILEIKEDVRDESEKFGTVTNVVLYDQEDDGVVTVRFSDATAAEACRKVFNGRAFDGKTVEAYIAKGKERFKKSKNQEDEGEEAARLESFSNFLEGREQ